MRTFDLFGLPHRARLLAAGVLGLLAASPACASPPPASDPPQGQAQVVAFVGVNVIPMDRERVLENQTVVVRDGRIAQVGPAAQVRAPAGALVVEGRGKYLIPGLAEMHAHIPPGNAPQAAIDRTLFLYLSAGVTTIRGMLGHPRHLELRDQAERNAILSPRIITSGPSLNGNSAPNPEAAARMVREQRSAGYDFLKIHPGLSRATFDAMDQAADRQRLAFSGHVPAEVGLRRALEAKFASIDHLDGYAEALAGLDTWNPEQTGLFGIALAGKLDESKIPELARATKAAGVWNVPTQTLMEQLASPESPEEMAKRPEIRYITQQTLQQWITAKRDFQAAPGFNPQVAQRYVETRRRILKGLADAGAGLLLGSDAPQWWNVPGFSARRELELMVAAGLTPYQALESGTRNPAVFFGVEDQWGTVQEGRSADLVLLDANPLADASNIWRQAGVMVRGRWLPQSEIDRRLEAIAAEVRGS